MTEPRNALVRQYEKLFAIEDRKLSFTPDALHEIARRALNRGTGARALRSLFEAVMLDLMYELPARDDLREFVITPEVIRGDADLLAAPREQQRDSA